MLYVTATIYCQSILRSVDKLSTVTLVGTLSGI